MKYLLKLALKYYLKYITKLVLFIHKPIIIAIAGSTNKTFVKQEIVSILEKNSIKARANPKNFNTDIGLPLAILDLPSGYNEYKNWIPAIIQAPKKIFQKHFPAYLVLELGISDPGDMKHLLTIINPKIRIVTDITQRYLESFSDMDNLVNEYEYFVKNANPTDLIILNNDNIRVRNLKKISQSLPVFFGSRNNSDIQISKVKKGGLEQKVSVIYNGAEKNFIIKKTGQHHTYALLISLIIDNYVTGQK